MSNELALPAVTGFNGAVTESYQLSGVTKFVANLFKDKFTLVAGNRAAGIKATTFKQLKEGLLLKGVTKEELKAVQKDYDANRELYYRQVRPIVAALATDQRFRQTMKVWKTKAGKTSINVAFREVKQSSAIDQLQAEVLRLTALLNNGKALPAS